MKANKITMKNIPLFALSIVQDLKDCPGIKKTRIKKQRGSMAYSVTGYGDFDGDMVHQHLQGRLKYYYLTYFHHNSDKEIKRMKEINSSLEIKERAIKKVLSDKISDLSHH